MRQSVTRSAHTDCYKWSKNEKRTQLPVCWLSLDRVTGNFRFWFCELTSMFCEFFPFVVSCSLWPETLIDCSRASHELTVGGHHIVSTLTLDGRPCSLTACATFLCGTLCLTQRLWTLDGALSYSHRLHRVTRVNKVEKFDILRFCETKVKIWSEAGPASSASNTTQRTKKKKKTQQSILHFRSQTERESIYKSAR